jgi:hypothetical protein
MENYIQNYLLIKFDSANSVLCNKSGIKTLIESIGSIIEIGSSGEKLDVLARRSC